MLVLCVCVCMQGLIDATGILDEAFDVFEVVPASVHTMRKFHSRAFVDALQKSFSPATCEMHGLVDDCATFRGVFELAALEVGGSVQAAQLLGSGKYDTAIWWGGGRHVSAASLCLSCTGAGYSEYCKSTL